MAKQVINLGTAPNGLDGDDARTAFQKAMSNFDELYGGTVSQPANAKLSALAGLTWANNQMIYTTGANTAAMTPLTLAGRALLDDADAPAQRVTLGLGGQVLQALQAVAMTANGVPYFASTSTMAVAPSTAFGRTLWAWADATAGRTALELGTAATLNVTTSDTDNTVGRITRVGNGGLLGANAPSTTQESWYGNRFVGWSNTHPAGPSNQVAVGLDMGYGANRRFQFAIDYLGAAFVRAAQVDPTTAAGWKHLMADGDFGIGVPSGDGNAPTITNFATRLASGLYKGAFSAANSPPGTTAGSGFTALCLAYTSTTCFYLVCGVTDVWIGYYNGTTVAWTNIGGIGNGQTWKDETANRALGTTYTNSTGKPIQVDVLVNGTSAANVTVTLVVNGVTIRGQYASGAGQYIHTITAIVPPGATYRAAVANGTGNLGFWNELS